MKIIFNHGKYTTKSYQVWVVGHGERWMLIYHSGKNADCTPGDGRPGAIQSMTEFTSESAATFAGNEQARKKKNGTGYEFKGWDEVPMPKAGSVTAQYDKLRAVFGSERADKIWAYIGSEVEKDPPVAAAKKVKEAKADSVTNPEWGTW